jgi:hypothetical protein
VRPAPTGRAGAGAGASGPAAARRFVGRLALLDREALCAALDAWRELMRAESATWFAAEAAAARAVAAAGRHDDQRPLLVHLSDAFARLVWSGGWPPAPGGLGAAPERRARGSEAGGLYVATVAMLAVLVRDHLDAATFALLYAPFATLVPPAELERE